MPAYHRQLQAIAREFFSTKGTPASAKEIARWAITEGLWKPTSDLAERRRAQDLASALREEYRQDPQGRQVRVNHTARLRQNSRMENVWDNEDRASRKFMEVSLVQRRNGIVGDCRKLKPDVDSYNENRCPDDPIQMTFNFTNDLAEFEAAAKAMKKAG